VQPTNPYAAPAAEEGFIRPPERAGPFRRILNIGFHLYFTNLLPITIVTLIIWSPCELFQSYMDHFVLDPESFGQSFRLRQFLDGFFGIIGVGAVIALQDATLRGETISIWQSLDEGFSAWPRLFWSSVLRSILLLVALIALIIPFLYYLVRLALVEQVAMIEHTGAVDSIKRAHELSARRFWLLAGLTFLPHAAIWLIAVGIAIPFGIFPELDHWLLSAALALPVDVLSQIPTTLLVVAYFEFTRAPPAANPPAPITASPAHSPAPP
jgi:hypothetical protein